MTDYTLGDVQHFLLVFFRMTGLFLTAPVFGSGQLPVPLKIWLSFTMAWVIVPLVPPSAVPMTPNLGIYVTAVSAEMAIGMVLGMAAQLLFVIVQMGGMIMGQELGLTLANVIDPITNEQVSILAQLKLIVGALIYLAIDGHHVVIRAAAESFASIPLGGFRLEAPAATLVADTMVVEMLQLSIQVAAPALVSMFLITLALAFMARTVPEMNIFAVGFALRLVIGLLVVAIGVPVFRWVFLAAYEKNVLHLGELLKLMASWNPKSQIPNPNKIPNPNSQRVARENEGVDRMWLSSKSGGTCSGLA